MPLYEYECEAAGHRFEVIQKFSDAPVDTCRVCGSPVHKLQSAPAFHLKGTGWYATDYAKSGGTAESKGGKDSKDGKDGKKDGGGKARPARVRQHRPMLRRRHRHLRRRNPTRRKT